MSYRNIIPSTSRAPLNKNLHLSYKNCKAYNPNFPEESRCNTDSTIGYCIIENSDNYESREGIREHGDIR